MKINYKILILLLLGVQALYVMIGCTKDKSIKKQEPQKVVLDITGITKFGHLNIEVTITDPDFMNITFGTADEKGNIYVVDSRACKVFKFAADGKLMGKAGQKGIGPQEFGMPVKILKSEEKLYVFDYQRPYVTVFDTQLEFLEQKKFPHLMHPQDATFIDENELIITSATMLMMSQYKFFLFNLDGNMMAKYEKMEDLEPSKVYQGDQMNIPFPPLISFDRKTGNLWAADIYSYMLDKYGEKFNIIKVFQGNIKYRMETMKVAKGQYSMKRPADRPIFFSVIGGKVFYGYKFHDEILLDIIENEKNIRRFKSDKVVKFLSYIDDSRFLVNLKGEEPSIGIVKISE